MMTTRWAERLRPQARLRDTTITWTSPRANKCSTSRRSSSVSPSCKYATPLLTVSRRVYRHHTNNNRLQLTHSSTNACMQIYLNDIKNGWLNNFFLFWEMTSIYFINFPQPLSCACLFNNSFMFHHSRCSTCVTSFFLLFAAYRSFFFLICFAVAPQGGQCNVLVLSNCANDISGFLDSSNTQCNDTQ